MLPKTLGQVSSPPNSAHSVSVLRTEERGWCGQVASELGRKAWAARTGSAGRRLLVKCTGGKAV